MFSIEYKLKIGFKSHFTSKTLKIDFKLLEAEVLGEWGVKIDFKSCTPGTTQNPFQATKYPNPRLLEATLKIDFK